jgi:hypothetical protein
MPAPIFRMAWPFADYYYYAFLSHYAMPPSPFFHTPLIRFRCCRFRIAAFAMILFSPIFADFLIIFAFSPPILLMPRLLFIDELFAIADGHCRRRFRHDVRLPLRFSTLPFAAISPDFR